jgi:hypothetical protein
LNSARTSKKGQGFRFAGSPFSFTLTSDRSSALDLRATVKLWRKCQSRIFYRGVEADGQMVVALAVDAFRREMRAALTAMMPDDIRERQRLVTPRPTYNPGVSTNRVNAEIGITDIPLGGTKADIVFWGKNIFNHADGGYAFGAGNGLNAAQNIAQKTVFLQPPRTYGVDFRIKF